jgi:hypothetical protein
MIYYNGGVCYILLKEELLLMNIAKAYEEMARLIKTGRR